MDRLGSIDWPASLRRLQERTSNPVLIEQMRKLERTGRIDQHFIAVLYAENLSLGEVIVFASSPRL